MKREAISRNGVWTGKKHYILDVYDNEGVRYAEPKLKTMGMEAVRSSTPKVCREALKEAYGVLLREGEDALREYVSNFEREFNQMPFEDVSFPRSCRYINKWKDAAMIYRKGTPIHVRGTLLYNKLIEEKKLTRKFDYIHEGDKIRFCYMKLPNPIRENVFAVPTVLPVELGLNGFVDYEKQFSKSFKEPLSNICQAVGWSLEKQFDLTAFFG